MAKVKNLKISKQSGSDNTMYATWQFESTVTVTSSSLKVGSWVTVKSGAKWYNGVTIPSFVFGEEWKVIQIEGDRVVINENRSGTHKIMSAISSSNLNVVGGGSSSVTEDTVDHYTVEWAYDTGNGVWFEGGSSDTSEKNATYNPPSNAIIIRVTVTPVSKTREVNGEETAYWTGTPVSATFKMDENAPEVPPMPTINIEQYSLTATIENVTDSKTDQIEFEVYNQISRFTTGVVPVYACMATFQCSVNSGGQYRVRARAINTNVIQVAGTNVAGDNIYKVTKVYSDWTEFTSSESTIPSTPTGITTIRGASETSIYLEWSPVSGAETYELQYTTDINHFESNDASSISGIESTYYTVTGLESGEEYFFRVRATNAQGSSGWSGIKSVVLGKAPAAPTTWSSLTTVIVGDPLILYWVHNSEDGSKETYAELEITVNDKTETHTIKNENSGTEEDDETHSYSVDTSSYQEGAKIKWRVRTAGITLQYGDWSIMRTVDIYAPPTLQLNVTNQNGENISVLTSFPFFIKGLAGPSTQMPIGYHVTITANEGYETVDNLGRPKQVNAGESVYFKYIDTNDPLLVEISAFNVDLQDGVGYTVTVIASMNSGLTATSSVTFDVSWTDEEFDIDAEIAINIDSYVAYITPYCRTSEGVEVENVRLSVYRREFDGQFTEIATGLDPSKNTMVVDPHPAMDYARYRLIATSTLTGAISYYDPPGYPIKAPGAIIQWDEEWSRLDVTNPDAETVRPLWTGSLLRLLYNVDVSDNTSIETTLVSYIGRNYPVSYYGTQIDTKCTWNLDIPAYDAETLYGLRRLAIWKGDVYVRESSGSGYWANVGVSFNRKHLDTVIPVTIDITRVSGGA